jgi:hypothetical protein
MALREKHFQLLDLIVKGVFGAVIAGAVAYYGYVLQDQREKVQERNRNLQATVELTSKQKDLDIDIGMRMLSSLMTFYFHEDKSARSDVAIRQQMLLLRLIALNFQDVPIHLRPLFEELDRQLLSEKDRETLRAIAQEVARRQATRLTVEHGVDSGPVRVKSGGVVELPALLVKARIESIGKDTIFATIVSDFAKPLGPFTVSFYDVPIVDNSKLKEYRFAIVLQKIEGSEAEIRFIAFPKYLATDRFDIKEAARDFRDRDPTTTP